MGSGLYKYNTEGKNENMKCQKLVDKIQGRLSYTLTLALNEIRIQIKPLKTGVELLSDQ